MRYTKRYDPRQCIRITMPIRRIRYANCNDSFLWRYEMEKKMFVSFLRCNTKFSSYLRAFSRVSPVTNFQPQLEADISFSSDSSSKVLRPPGLPNRRPRNLIRSLHNLLRDAYISRKLHFQIDRIITLMVSTPNPFVVYLLALT